MRRMSAREVSSRARQFALQRRDAFYHKLGIDPAVPALHYGSPVGGRFFFDSDGVPQIVEALREHLPSNTNRIIQRADRICQHEFDLLGYSGVDYGPRIDWSHDAVHNRRAPKKPWHQVDVFDFATIGDPKIIWELNRHQHLVILAKAWCLTVDERYASEVLAQWLSWVEQNPYPIGINWASSLEVAFRSMSWLWMRALLGNHPSFTMEFHQRLLRLLAVHGAHIRRYLSTYASPNTHLLGEAVGLMFIGVLCPEIAAATRWRELGWSIVQREMQRQVRSDGMHFEQSTYYHVYALDFFLHARILGERNGLCIPDEYEEGLQRMLNLLAALCEAGNPPRLGDDDGGRVFDGQRNLVEHLSDPLATGAVVYGREDWKRLSGIREETLWLLGSEAAESFDRSRCAIQPSQQVFAVSGIYRLGTKSSELVIDAGPHGSGRGGHGHADALSLTWRVDGAEVLCDPGTYVYSDAGGRELLRATNAHNTLEADGRNQADVAGPFAWKELTKATVMSYGAQDPFQYLRARHVGYTRLPEPLIHTRTVFSLAEELSVVRDIAEGGGVHELTLSWHFASDKNPQLKDSVVSIGSTTGHVAQICLAGSQPWLPSLEPSFVSPVYGVRVPAAVLRLRYKGAIPVENVTLLIPGEIAREVNLRYDPMASTPGVSIYQLCRTGAVSDLVFNDARREWNFRDWASDAEFLFVTKENGEITEIFGSAVSHLSFCRQYILQLSQPQDVFVWRAGVGEGRNSEIKDMLSLNREAVLKVHS